MPASKLTHAASRNQIAFFVGATSTVRKNVVKCCGQRTQRVVLVAINPTPSRHRGEHLHKQLSCFRGNDLDIAEATAPTIALVDPVLNRRTGHTLFNSLSQDIGGHTRLPVDRWIDFSGDALRKLTEDRQICFGNQLFRIFLTTFKYSVCSQRQPVCRQVQFRNRRQETLARSVRWFEHRKIFSQ